jgi:hypothetical protein
VTKFEKSWHELVERPAPRSRVATRRPRNSALHTRSSRRVCRDRGRLTAKRSDGLDLGYTPVRALINEAAALIPAERLESCLVVASGTTRCMLRHSGTAGTISSRSTGRCSRRSSYAVARSSGSRGLSPPRTSTPRSR